MNENRQNANATLERRTLFRFILSGFCPALAGLIFISSPSRAQETKPLSVVPSTVSKVPQASEADPKKAEFKPSDSLVPASTNAAPAEVPVVAVPLAAKSPVNQYLTREKVEALQERIRPSVQDIEARGGAVRFLWSQRHQPSSMLQLINPLAPTEYGVSSVSPYQIPASVAPGQPPLPRGLRDDRTHEANGIFFRAGW